MSKSLIKEVINRINKAAGASIAFSPEEHPEKITCKYIPTNVQMINDAIGGGIPTKNITVISGTQGSGKTAFLASAMKYAVDVLGYIGVYINAEPGWPKTTFENVGIDLDGEHKDKIVVIQPDQYGEQIVDGIFAALKARNKDQDNLENPPLFIAYDSINAFMPKKQVDRQEDAKKGLTSDGMTERARALTTFLETLAGQNMLDGDNLLVIVAQERTTGFGGPVVTTDISGGQAVKFMPKLVLKLMGKILKRKEEINGMDVYVPYASEVSWGLIKNTASGLPISAGKYIYTYPNKLKVEPGGIDDTQALIEWLTDTKRLFKESRTFRINLNGEIINLDVTKKDEIKMGILAQDGLMARLKEFWANSSLEVQEALLEETALPTEE